MRHYNIPIFVPHMGCPHDCVFCNQRRITGSHDEVTPEYVKKTVGEYLDSFKEKGIVEISFFGGSFTGISKKLQFSLLEVAQQFVLSGEVSGIRLSTRPDYITEEILDYLNDFGVTTIELGVQSMEQKVLEASKRGYDAACVVKSVALIRKYSFSLGLQMMTGLPYDTMEYSINTAAELCKLKPDFVRIYPTLIVRDTELAHMFKNGTYKPFSLLDTVELAAKIKKMFLDCHIDVIRVGLQTTEEINPNCSVLGGPFHSAIGELVDSKLYLDLLYQEIGNLKNCSVDMLIPKGERSKVLGHKKSNAIELKNNRNIELSLYEDEKIEKYTLKRLTTNNS